MPLSATVKIAKSTEPRWPEQCIACNAEIDGGRGSTLNWWTHAIGWWTFALLSFGRPYHVKDVPVCMMCKQRVRWQRRLRILVSVAILFGAAFIWLTVFRGQQFAFKRAAVAGLAIAALLPWLAWEVFVPPPLDVTAYKDTVDFDFRNPEYARKFAMLNDAEVE